MPARAADRRVRLKRIHQRRTHHTTSHRHSRHRNGDDRFSLSHGDTRWDQVINKGQDWTVTIARNGIQPGKARGIGGALVVKIKNTPDMKEIDPPAIETVTWCEPITVEGGGSAA